MDVKSYRLGPSKIYRILIRLGKSVGSGTSSECALLEESEKGLLN